MCDICIKQVTKKVKQLFQLKSKNTHPSGVTYEGTFSCKESNIGETTPNIEFRREEHEDAQRDSQAAKRLRNHPGLSFTWKVFLSASTNKLIRKTWKCQ